MKKAKELYQKKVRFQDDVKETIIDNSKKEIRSFDAEVNYQLRKAYGLLEGVTNAQ
ncbi:Arc family DNA binding domain-containing protein [Gilliamella sp. Bif1-4]|uniref:Arc family DNA binding domain-containing protein n=1 Tax=Gilliamella sp. Bif1-4 TaxID=3120233 RepID=UPI00080EC58F|nr:Arc family DNA binding domain-containing protein [Gilliamella apicola]OCG39719.1 Arc family DNA binding domain-containing protein [Gilliamella apicola]